MMDSSISNNFHHQNNQPSSGLLRFRSAPSTLLANFNDNGVSGNDCGLNFQQFEEKPGGRVRETAVNYPNSGQSYSGLPPHYPRQNSGTSSSAMDSSFGLVGSMPMNHREQVKRLDASLARQSNSPGGLFGNLSIQNGYNGAKLAGTYGGMNGTDREGSPRLNSQLSFPSRGPSSIGMLAQISQVGNESMDTASPVNGKHGNSNGNARFYGSPRYSYASWNDSHFPGNFSIATKRDEDNNTKLFSSPQNGELDSRVHLLSHHLSLPKTSAEMVAMEKFLHFQDSVPCKIRAKRGCATHPRSIAERLRRTRISERMRKLQDLVPNMDKQTNTADMLDLAVDYIKELQRQYKSLSDSRANCRCSSRQKAVQNQMS